MNTKRLMKHYFDRVPVLGYIVLSFLKCFLIAALIILFGFAGLWLTGIYSELESRLNLSYNSPIVWVPMAVFFALALLSLFIGAVLYFQKYKRKKKKSEFREVLMEAFRGVGTD